jgi:hypothetical protein
MAKWSTHQSALGYQKTATMSECERGGLVGEKTESWDTTQNARMIQPKLEKHCSLMYYKGVQQFFWGHCGDNQGTKKIFFSPPAENRRCEIFI